jgi:hypothetical protein
MVYRTSGKSRKGNILSVNLFLLCRMAQTFARLNSALGDLINYDFPSRKKSGQITAVALPYQSPIFRLVLPYSANKVSYRRFPIAMGWTPSHLKSIAHFRKLIDEVTGIQWLVQKVGGQ